MFPWPSVIFPLTAAPARLPQSCYLTRSTSSNYPTLIMERIVPHRSTRRRRGGGNHPFVWVTVCNDFSLLLPSDLHVLYKCVCEVVCYCWALAGEPSLSHVMEAEMNGVITSDGFLCLSVHFVLIRCVSEALLLLLLPSFSRWTLPGCDSVVFFSFCWLWREREAFNIPGKNQSKSFIRLNKFPYRNESCFLKCGYCPKHKNNCEKPDLTRKPWTLLVWKGRVKQPVVFKTRQVLLLTDPV